LFSKKTEKSGATGASGAKTRLSSKSRDSPNLNKKMAEAKRSSHQNLIVRIAQNTI